MSPECCCTKHGTSTTNTTRGLVDRRKSDSLWFAQVRSLRTGSTTASPALGSCLTAGVLGPPCCWKSTPSLCGFAVKSKAKTPKKPKKKGKTLTQETQKLKTLTTLKHHLDFRFDFESFKDLAFKGQNSRETTDGTKKSKEMSCQFLNLKHISHTYQKHAMKNVTNKAKQFYLLMLHSHNHCS